MSELASNVWTCRWHGSVQTGQQECLSCLAAFEQRREAASMTGDERAEELRRMNEQVTITFDRIHQRVEELVGRPVWTHEMALWDELVEEARTWQHGGMVDVLSKLPWDKPAILIDPTTGDMETLP